MKKKNIFIKVLLTISIICFTISLYNIARWFIDNKHTKDINKMLEEITEIKVKDENINNSSEIKNYELVNAPDDLSDSYYNYVDEEFLDVEFTKLKEVNSDVVAYVLVPGTDISYPVVQSSDNKYYLRHSLDKAYSKAGWIFMDYRNDYQEYGKNTIIYGHKRNDGSMFTSLSNVLTDDWFNNSKNHIVKLSSEKENTIWQIFSVYKIYEESYYITTKFKTDKLYENYLNDMKNRSKYNFNTSVNINDKVLTLSTCYDYKGNRVVVHAKLIKRENKN